MDERLGRFRAHQGVTIGGVFQNFAEGADDREVIAGIRFRGAEDEHQADVLIAVFEEHAVVAAADGENYALNMFGARVRQGDFVAEASRVEAFAGEQLVIEALKIGDLRMAVEEARDLVESDGAFATLDGERDARRIEELRQTAGHDTKIKTWTLGWWKETLPANVGKG